jgi:rhomboid protease GluP
MKDIGTKFKILFLPLLFCMVISSVGYTFLNWLFVIKLAWFAINEKFIHFFIPAGISVVLVVFILRPRIKQLQFKNDNGSFGLSLISVLVIGIPLIILQEYTASQSGKITSLASIYEIDSLPKTKYYSLKDYYFHKKGVGIKIVITVSGKHNETLNYTLYSVQPIFKTASDTVKNSTHYWLCKLYNDHLSNRLSYDEKESAYNRFVQKSETSFKDYTPTFTYLERFGITDANQFYGNAASHSPLSRDGEDIFLKEREGTFADRSGKKSFWFFITTGIGLLLWIVLLLCFQLKTPKQLATDKKRSARIKPRGWRKNYECYLPKEGFYAAPVLIYCTLLVSLLMVITGHGVMVFGGRSLYSWGGLLGTAVEEGDWWRLFTTLFVHGNIVQLLNNLLSLYFIGLFLEPLLGQWRFLLFYLGCGLGSSLATIYWHDQTLSVGASGAIFGMYGLLLALVLMSVFERPLSRLFLIIGGLFVVVNLSMVLLTGTDYAGLVGGLVTGFVIGLLVSSQLKREAF